jgi:hypothetical protein
VKSCFEENIKSGLSIRVTINLHPQGPNRFSAAFSPLLHRFIAGFPQPNPQIFRPFSASFAHGIGRIFFRSLCAAISQALAARPIRKWAKKRRSRRRCGKEFAVRGSQFAARFSTADCDLRTQ